MVTLTELTSDDVLDTAYDWLCRRRRAYPAGVKKALRRAWEFDDADKAERLLRNLARPR